jgi:thioredoxin-related protein
MQTIFRHLTFILLCFFASQSYTAESSLIEVKNLKLDAATAKEKNMVVVVLVTLPNCSFCEYVKHEVMEPMIKAGDLADVALMRELSLQDYSIIDFDGSKIKVNDFANRYSADFAPIMLFLSPNGDQLHKPIIGLSSRDYYGFYLEEAIEKSVLALNK